MLDQIDVIPIKVTDEALDHDTYTFTHTGQEVKLCCKSCLKDFEKEPSKFLSKLK